MKYSKLMKERIRRVKVLFKELGYNVFDGERQEESFTAGFEDNTGFQSGFFYRYREQIPGNCLFLFLFSETWPLH